MRSDIFMNEVSALEFFGYLGRLGKNSFKKLLIKSGFVICILGCFLLIRHCKNNV